MPQNTRPSSIDCASPSSSALCDNSKLVINQVMKESSCKSPLMAAYCQEVRKLEDKFQGIELRHILQKDNNATDFLAKLAARRDPSLSGIFINDLPKPFTCVLEGPIQTRPDVKPAPEGSDPDAKLALGAPNPVPP